MPVEEVEEVDTGETGGSPEPPPSAVPKTKATAAPPPEPAAPEQESGEEPEPARAPRQWITPAEVCPWQWHCRPLPSFALAEPALPAKLTWRWGTATAWWCRR